VAARGFERAGCRDLSLAAQSYRRGTVPCVRGVRLAGVVVEHLFGMPWSAVISISRHPRATHRRLRFRQPSQNFDSLDRGVEIAGVSDHVGIAKLQMMTSYTPPRIASISLSVTSGALISGFLL